MTVTYLGERGPLTPTPLESPDTKEGLCCVASNFYLLTCVTAPEPRQQSPGLLDQS